MLYGVIAVAGTALFGFSFGLVYTSTGTPWNWSLAITIAAGCGWLVFIPGILLIIAKENRTLAIHACLMTMVFGEAVLEIGTILNLIGYWRENISSEHALVGNCVLVAISNLVMAIAICAQLKAVNLSVRRVIILWTVLLNAVGAGAFFFLYQGVLTQ